MHMWLLGDELHVIVLDSSLIQSACWLRPQFCLVCPDASLCDVYVCVRYELPRLICLIVLLSHLIWLLYVMRCTYDSVIHCVVPDSGRTPHGPIVLSLQT